MYTNRLYHIVNPKDIPSTTGNSKTNTSDKSNQEQSESGSINSELLSGEQVSGDIISGDAKSNVSGEDFFNILNILAIINIKNPFDGGIGQKELKKTKYNNSYLHLNHYQCFLILH